MSGTVQTTVKLSKELSDKVDKAKWVVRKSKNEFYVTAIKRYIDELEKQGLLTKYDELFSEIIKKDD